MIDPAKRRLGIGGSEVAAILGLDSFQDAFEVWAKKMGELPEDDGPNERMTLGKILEPALLSIYTYITKREVVYWDQTMRDESRPWMVFTPDAICCAGRRGVDCKVVAWDQSFNWGKTVDKIPDHVTLQCLWYMAGLDYDQWDVMALVAGEPRIYTVERDLELEDIVLPRVERWWRRYIVGGEMPPITASEGASRWLQRKFPRDRRPDLVTPSAEQLAMFQEYARVRADEAVATNRRKQLEAQLKLSLGEHEGLKLSGGDKFTWRLAEDSKEVVTNWESVARGLLHEYVKDKELEEQLISIQTSTKITKGVRRISFKSKQLSAAEAA